MDAHTAVREASAAAVANGHRPVLMQWLWARGTLGEGGALMLLNMTYGRAVYAAVRNRVMPFYWRKLGGGNDPRVKYRGRW